MQLLSPGLVRKLEDRCQNQKVSPEQERWSVEVEERSPVEAQARM